MKKKKEFSNMLIEMNKAIRLIRMHEFIFYLNLYSSSMLIFIFEYNLFDYIFLLTDYLIFLIINNNQDINV